MAGALERVLVCSPRTAGWNQPGRAARWHDLGFHHAPDFATAQSQHEALCRELKTAGAEVIELASRARSLPRRRLHPRRLPSHRLRTDRHASRQTQPRRRRPAPRLILRDPRPSQPSARSPPPGTTEAGDIVWLDSKTLLIGHGYRTNAAGIRQMRDLLAPKGVEVLSAPLPLRPRPVRLPPSHVADQPARRTHRPRRSPLARSRDRRTAQVSRIQLHRNRSPPSATR